MKLDMWLKSNNVTRAQFAKKIGVARSTVYRYIDGTRLPDRAYMRAIREVTGGKVRSNDFEEGVVLTQKRRRRRERT